MSFAHCTVPSDAGMAALAAWPAVSCCISLAALVLPQLKDPAIYEALGSGTTYRLITACSWAFGADAQGILRAGLRAIQALGFGRSNGAWEALVRGTEKALQTAIAVITVGPLDSPSGPPPHARAVLATLCKPGRLTCLLDAAAEVLLGVDAA